MKYLASLLLVMFIFASMLTTHAQDSKRQVTFVAGSDTAVLPIGAAGTWDDTSIRFPYVLFHDGKYHLFYVSFKDLTTPQAIGYASSEDGITWTRAENNPVFIGDGTGFDAMSINRAVVFVEDDTWVMYYNGSEQFGNPPFGPSIGRATAPAPEGPWTSDEEPVLTAGTARRWDGAYIFPDTVLSTKHGYLMYYSGLGIGLGMLGMATSPDGITWTKYDDPATPNRPYDESDPVLKPGNVTEWDGEFAWGAGIQLTSKGYEMVYTGSKTITGGFKGSLGYALSEDGIHWTKYADNPVFDMGDSNILFASLLVQDDTYLAYFGVAPQNAALTEPYLAIGTVEDFEQK
jgi:hypothetical protein